MNDDNPMLTAALDYATKQKWPVFPLAERSKTPDGRLAPRGFYDATTDPARIRQWWTANPKANIGVRTGGGLVVVDADSEDALTEIVDRDPDSTTTAVVKTARGYQLYTSHYGPVKCRTGVLPDLDLKADGGYVVAPPSIHPTGHQYAWDVAPHEVAEIAPFPTWLCELVETETPPPPPLAPVIERRTAGPLPPTVDPGAAALFSTKLDELARAPEGTRNETLNEVSYTVGGLVASGRLDQATAERGLAAAARAAGLGDRETAKTMRSGLTAGATRPLDSRPRPLQVLRPGELVEIEPPPPWDDIAPPLVPDAPPTREPRFRLYTAAEWKNRPDPSWLCDGLLVQDTLAAVIGAWRSFKTFFALDLGLSVATGTPFHGRVVVSGPVVYVSAEGASGLARRIRAWEIARKVSVDAAPFYVLPDTVHLLSHEDVDELRTVIMGLPTKPVLVVIDTLARCLLPGDENSARDMGQAVEAGDVIRRATGATVLMLHHPAKNGGKARGSGALPGGVDTELTLTRKDDVVTVETTKQKDGPECEPWALRPAVVELSERDQDTSIVLDLTDLPVGVVTPTHRKMIAALRSIADDGHEVSGAEWRAACQDVKDGVFYNNIKPMVASGWIKATGSTRDRTYAITHTCPE